MDKTPPAKGEMASMDHICLIGLGGEMCFSLASSTAAVSFGCQQAYERLMC
jgi:hypothetical protein